MIISRPSKTSFVAHMELSRKTFQNSRKNYENRGTFWPLPSQTKTFFCAVSANSIKHCLKLEKHHFEKTFFFEFLSLNFICGAELLNFCRTCSQIARIAFELVHVSAAAFVTLRAISARKAFGDLQTLRVVSKENARPKNLLSTA